MVSIDNGTYHNQDVLQAANNAGGVSNCMTVRFVVTPYLQDPQVLNLAERLCIMEHAEDLTAPKLCNKTYVGTADLDRINEVRQVQTPANTKRNWALAKNHSGRNLAPVPLEVDGKVFEGRSFAQKHKTAFETVLNLATDQRNATFSLHIKPGSKQFLKVWEVVPVKGIRSGIVYKNAYAFQKAECRHMAINSIIHDALTANKAVSAEDYRSKIQTTTAHSLMRKVYQTDVSAQRDLLSL